jgi:hypothetical protein
MTDMDFFEQDKPIDQITMQELDLLGQVIFKQRQACEEQEKILDSYKEKLAKLQAKMISVLEKFGRSNYSIPGQGMLIKSERLTVTLPKTPEDKDAFYKYLKDKNLFEDIVTVNSMTLNAFYKKEFDIAAKEGRAVGFKIPGISDPKIITTLNMRKGK